MAVDIEPGGGGEVEVVDIGGGWATDGLGHYWNPATQAWQNSGPTGGGGGSAPGGKPTGMGWGNTPTKMPDGSYYWINDITGEQVPYAGATGGGGGAPSQPNAGHITLGDGSIWTTDPKTGLPVTMLSGPKPGPAGPGGPGDNGFNPATSLPWGVVRDPTSPSNYLYNGQPVNADGSPYTAGQAKKKTSLYKRPDGGVDLIDEDGNIIRSVYDPAPSSGGGGGASRPATTTYPMTLGGGGGESTRDYPAEQTAQNAFSMDYLRAQQEFQRAESEIARAFQSGQTVSEQQWQSYENAQNRLNQAELQNSNLAGQFGLQQGSQQFQAGQDALNLAGQFGLQQGSQEFNSQQAQMDRIGQILQAAQNQEVSLYGQANANNLNQQQFAATYGQNNAQIDLARRQAGLEGAAQLSAQMQDFDPAGALAFYAAGGNNIANAMAGGGDALTGNALAGAALTLRNQSQPLTPLTEYQWTPQTANAPGPINLQDWLAQINAGGGTTGGGTQGVPDWLQAILGQSQQQQQGVPEWLQAILGQGQGSGGGGTAGGGTQGVPAGGGYPFPKGDQWRPPQASTGGFAEGDLPPKTGPVAENPPSTGVRAEGSYEEVPRLPMMYGAFDEQDFQYADPRLDAILGPTGHWTSGSPQPGESVGFTTRVNPDGSTTQIPYYGKPKAQQTVVPMVAR